MVQLVMTMLLFGMLSAFAFWQSAPVLFMVSGGVGLATAFYWYDTYTNNFGLAVSLVLLALSLYYLAVAFRAMFIRVTRSEGADEY